MFLLIIYGLKDATTKIANLEFWGLFEILNLEFWGLF